MQHLRRQQFEVSQSFANNASRRTQTLLLSFVLLSLVSEQRIVFVCTATLPFLASNNLAKSIGYSHTNTSLPLYIISLHQLECQRRTYSTRSRWLENESAASKQPLQTTQIMNINNITRVYAKITGGGGITASRACVCSGYQALLFPCCPAPLAPGYEARSHTQCFPLFSSSLSGWVVSARFGVNLLIWLIIPRNLLTSCILLGDLTFCIACTFSDTIHINDVSQKLH